MRIAGLFNVSGNLDEVEFWERLYELDKMDSFDGRFQAMDGDMWQHRINNPQDWGEDWFLSDSRINIWYFF